MKNNQGNSYTIIVTIVAVVISIVFFNLCNSFTDCIMVTGVIGLLWFGYVLNK